jgi:hypothetical protein
MQGQEAAEAGAGHQEGPQGVEKNQQGRRMT